MCVEEIFSHLEELKHFHLPPLHSSPVVSACDGDVFWIDEDHPSMPHCFLEIQREQGCLKHEIPLRTQTFGPSCQSVPSWLTPVECSKPSC